MADVSKVNTNDKFFFLDKSYFTSYKQILKDYPHNHILHNEIKKIIIAALKAKKLECLPDIIEFINNKSGKLSELKNQLYNIALEIQDEDVQKDSTTWESVK
mgnify:CR=1 FL=1